MEGSSVEDIPSTDDDDELYANAEVDAIPREEAGGAWEVIGATVESVPSEDATPSTDVAIAPTDGATPMPMSAFTEND